LEYPQHLHDAHVVLCSVRRDKPPNKWQDVLLTTLYDKKLTLFIIETYDNAYNMDCE